MFSRLGEVNEVQSFVPSRMKPITALDIKTNGCLKVKKCILVITSCKARSNLKDKIKDEEQASSHFVVVREADDLNDETKLAERQKPQKMQKASNMV